MHKDLKELLFTFNEHKVRYLVIGGYAVSYFTEPRATKDLDIFIATDPTNASLVFRALAAYGAPLSGLSQEDFCGTGMILQIGAPPLRIDVLQKIDGITFEEAWTNRRTGAVASDDTLETLYISLEDLIRNKEASGRLRDLADAEDLRFALRLNQREEE